ncbi:MAG: hypothetical protein GY814_02920 [Gammaproteobacteria bacterium]|nr:hypothetical protein [Gammaproteobacteria bacterium]
MECQICENEKTESVCATCSHQLGAFQHFMTELTGQSWHSNLVLCLPLDPDYVKIAQAFFCGMQIPFNVDKNRYIIHVDYPIYRPLTMEEQSR